MGLQWDYKQGHRIEDDMNVSRKEKMPALASLQKGARPNYIL